MNLVGQEGRGESVWLAFFLYDVLTQFAALAESRQDVTVAELCRKRGRSTQTKYSPPRLGWRMVSAGFFDNGQPLGSHANEVPDRCLPRVGLLLSGAGETTRDQSAIASAVSETVDSPEAGLIQLFDPPFDKSDLNPGYIKGYIPGCGRMAGNTPTPRSGPPWPLPSGRSRIRTGNSLASLNPIRHGRLRGENRRLQSGALRGGRGCLWGGSPRLGRGDWTWYTGSAGWMYRLVTESLLGLKEKATFSIATHNCPVDGMRSRCTIGSTRPSITSRSAGPPTGR